MTDHSAGRKLVRPTEMPELERLVSQIRAPSRADPRDVKAHLDDLTKPVGSLGHLEEIALRLAVILGDPPAVLEERTVFVFAADHGVTAHGVSAYPKEVTAQMCKNFSAGGAAINAIAGSVGARVVVADLGVDADLASVAGIHDRKIRRGTRDLSTEAAMTPAEAVQAIMAGASLYREELDRRRQAKNGGAQIVALGEMGIGNTTSASALTAAFTGYDPSAVVGTGTGIGDAAKVRKIDAIRAGLSRLDSEPDPVAVLAEVGGLEIAGLVGVVLAAAATGTPVITDGFIATAAILVAVALCPASREYVFPSHLSAEPAHRLQLQHLGLRPLIEFDLRLGEGTGAALALPILDAAGAILRNMATFSSAGVSGPAV